MLHAPRLVLGTLGHEKSGLSRSHDLPLSLQSPILIFSSEWSLLVWLASLMVGFFLSGLHSCSIPLSGSSLSFTSNHSYTCCTVELPHSLCWSPSFFKDGGSAESFQVLIGRFLTWPGFISLLGCFWSWLRPVIWPVLNRLWKEKLLSTSAKVK